MRQEEKNPRDQYIESLYGTETDLMKKSREAAEDFNLARISMAQVEGRILQFLVGVTQPKKIVEIGTLTGLSAQYILSALDNQEAKLWTLELNAEHARKASEILSSFGSRVEVVVGDARETLKVLALEQGPFDAVFIDGNKAAYLDYLNWALANMKSGGLIVVDNIFLNGAVWGDNSSGRFSDKQSRIVDEVNRVLADSVQFHSAVIPTFEGLYVAKIK